MEIVEKRKQSHGPTSKTNSESVETFAAQSSRYFAYPCSKIVELLVNV